MLPHLGNAVIGCIQKRVATDVVLGSKNLADFLRDVIASMVQCVWNVLEQDREWPANIHVAQEIIEQVRTTIMSEGFGMCMDFTKL